MEINERKSKERRNPILELRLTSSFHQQQQQQQAAAPEIE